MSYLNLNRKPMVIFDPSNSHHRETYHQFKANQNWGKSEYRFVVDDHTSNLIDYCDRKLVKWYLDKEFGSKTG